MTTDTTPENDYAAGSGWYPSGDAVEDAMASFRQRYPGYGIEYRPYRPGFDHEFFVTDKNGVEVAVLEYPWEVDAWEA